MALETLSSTQDFFISNSLGTTLTSTQDLVLDFASLYTVTSAQDIILSFPSGINLTSTQQFTFPNFTRGEVVNGSTITGELIATTVQGEIL